MSTSTTKKILLAEDDLFLQRMYATKLTDAGFQVLAADDGVKAVSLMKKHKPDLALIDILMPKKDGFEVVEEIKQDADIKGIPIIFLTNLSEVEDVKRAKKLGVTEYLIKSHFLPSEVIEIVQKKLL
jgi:CheY-like chemotaxis protein